MSHRPRLSASRRAVNSRRQQRTAFTRRDGVPTPLQRRALALVTLAISATCCLVATAELADLELRSGITVRGNVTETDTAFILRNELGEVRYPRDDVERMLPVVDAGDSRAALERAAGRLPSDASEPRLELAKRAMLIDEWSLALALLEQVLAAEPNHLRAERLRAEVSRRLDQPIPTADVETEIARIPLPDRLSRAQRDALWQRERLPGESPTAQPATLVTFRSDILPVIVATCTTSGCHGPTGPAHGFRLPAELNTEAGADTAFAILTDLDTPDGPLIDRDAPDYSLLLAYMLPADATPRPHPLLNVTDRIRPRFERPTEVGYRAIRDWIASLRYPRPEPSTPEPETP